MGEGVHRQTLAVTFVRDEEAPPPILILNNKKQGLETKPCFLSLPAGLADLFIERTLLQRSRYVNRVMITFLKAQNTTCVVIKKGPRCEQRGQSTGRKCPNARANTRQGQVHTGT